MVDKTAPKFQRTLDLLRNPEASFTAEATYSLSDLTLEQMDALRTIWPDIPADRRRDLLLRLVDIAETNFELDYSSVIRLALDDPDPEVRIAAIEGVTEDSPLNIAERLIELAQKDNFASVRAAAVGALGYFILQGELGKIPERMSQRVQDVALKLHNNLNEDIDVRRRALEAISNSTRDEVPDLIREAYDDDELLMRVSAVFAMGRTCDDMWSQQVMDELSSEYPQMRYEAARAAGEIELRKALPRLSEMAYDDDREVQEMAIWSMGEIGGQAASALLNQLAVLAEENGDEELSTAISEALSAASLVGEDLLPMLDFSEYEDDFEDDEFEEFEGFDVGLDLEDAEEDDDDREDHGF